VQIELESMTEKLKQLEEIIRRYGRVIVGYSGGVDSTLVAFVANRVLGTNASIILARMETITLDDVELARQIALDYRFNYREIAYNELEIEQYAANPINRCYFCRKELFRRLNDLAKEENIPFIFDGANLDDTSDYRPGRKAAQESGIHSPLIESSMTKQDVRAAAKFYNLPNSDKPATPCLSSRIPYGIHIDRKSLDQISHAEKFIHEKGFINVRVRHYQNTAKIEVDAWAVEKLKQMNNEIESYLKQLGYTEVLIDEEGFQSGKLNKGIVKV
jgi:pyridinium-3,5-biscarboxylic acid mononucleotide sulfurtransferase